MAPAVRIIGDEAGTPEGRQALERVRGEITRFVAGARQNRMLGQLRHHRVTHQVPECQMEYTYNDGQETLTLVPRVRRVEVPSKRSGPDMLLLEYIWEDNGYREYVPYMYLTGSVRYDFVTMNPPWTETCGVGMYIPPYGFSPGGAGTWGLYPPAVALAGASDNFHISFKSTAEAGRYLAVPSDAIYASSFPEIAVTGPDACNGSFAGFVSIPSPTPILLGGWSDFTGDPFAPSYEAYRWKGTKDMYPHRLLIRTEIEQISDAFVGATGGVGGGTWDSFKEYEYEGPPDRMWERFAHNNYTYPCSEKAKELYGAGLSETRRVHTVSVDLQWFRQAYGNILELNTSGFWLSPRNQFNEPNVSRYTMDVGDYDVWWPDDDSAVAFVESLGPLGAAWYDAPLPETTPRNVNVIATFVWGTTNPGKMTTVAGGDGKYGQKSFVLDPKLVAARQTTQNEPSPPTVLPWGDKFQKVIAYIDQVHLVTEEADA